MTAILEDTDIVITLAGKDLQSKGDRAIIPRQWDVCARDLSAHGKTINHQGSALLHLPEESERNVRKMVEDLQKGARLITFTEIRVTIPESKLDARGILVARNRADMVGKSEM